MEQQMPLVLSAAFRATVERLPDLLAMVSLSLDHFGVDTDSPFHANIHLMMHNEHTASVASFVPRYLLNLKLVQLLWEQRDFLYSRFSHQHCCLFLLIYSFLYLFHLFLFPCLEEADPLVYLFLFLFLSFYPSFDLLSWIPLLR